MDTPILLILILSLFSMTLALPTEQGQTPKKRDNEQKYKDVIMYLTPSQIRDLHQNPSHGIILPSQASQEISLPDGSKQKVFNEEYVKNLQREYAANAYSAKLNKSEGDAKQEIKVRYLDPESQYAQIGQQLVYHTEQQQQQEQSKLRNEEINHQKQYFILPSLPQNKQTPGQEFYINQPQHQLQEPLNEMRQLFYPEADFIKLIQQKNADNKIQIQDIVRQKFHLIPYQYLEEQKTVHQQLGQRLLEHDIVIEEQKQVQQNQAALNQPKGAVNHDLRIVQVNQQDLQNQKIQEALILQQEQSNLEQIKQQEYQNREIINSIQLQKEQSILKQINQQNQAIHDVRQIQYVQSLEQIKQQEQANQAVYDAIKLRNEQIKQQEQQAVINNALKTSPLEQIIEQEKHNQANYDAILLQQEQQNREIINAIQLQKEQYNAEQIKKQESLDLIKNQNEELKQLQLQQINLQNHENILKSLQNQEIQIQQEKENQELILNTLQNQDLQNQIKLQQNQENYYNVLRKESDENIRVQIEQDKEAGRQRELTKQREDVIQKQYEKEREKQEAHIDMIKKQQEEVHQMQVEYQQEKLKETRQPSHLPLELLRDQQSGGLQLHIQLNPNENSQTLTHLDVLNQQKLEANAFLNGQEKILEQYKQRQQELLNNNQDYVKLQYAPSYIDPKYSSQIERSIKKNQLEKAQADALAESIANSPPVVVHQDITITKRRPIHVIKSVNVPVPAPYLVPVPHPIEVKVPQPYPVPLEIIKPYPVEIVKTEKVEVEKPVPYEVEKHVPFEVEKKVYIKVDKPYTVERIVPIEVQKEIPVEIPIYKPKKLTILRHVWEHK